eukprot:SAG11_NODE_734_length_7466_cov_3.388625_5_plen_71_part_00
MPYLGQTCHVAELGPREAINRHGQDLAYLVDRHHAVHLIALVHGVVLFVHKFSSDKIQTVGEQTSEQYAG